MACHEAVTNTATLGLSKAPDPLCRVRPHCLLLVLEGGAMDIPTHRSGLQEADDLPKVTLGVSAGAGVKPSGVRW